MLELHRAARHFGGVRAVDGLDLKVNEREIVGLIGPNGSGKSTAVKVSAMTIGGAIAGVGGGIFAHYTTHIEHLNFNVLLATFAIAYPIVGGLNSVFGTLAAVVFVQAFLIEGLRDLGDWRNLLFGALIILAMNLRPQGLFGKMRGSSGA